jgi:hypothetical protein
LSRKRSILLDQLGKIVIFIVVERDLVFGWTLFWLSRVDCGKYFGLGLGLVK